ncbi:hypothetical protein [Sulfobacillus harzensis]|uniref:Uncharacterized protein n=1 Tax=Sulfobacillus harzensis TaxID=2729629 RepID=A0A7Y0Q0X8_9FIRM|nr:hypothetical protein [Sulfobacillus harzensis]NMP20882.1 hypothetical protein [Sulfobacillus harzensis]
MADWSGTLTFSEDSLQALDAFIHHPDTRQTDIFQQGTLAVDGQVHLDWIIKHDIFEGVVMHVSLMGDDGTRFLGGDGAVLTEAQEALRTFDVNYEGTTYHLSVVKE